MKSSVTTITGAAAMLLALAAYAGGVVRQSVDVVGQGPAGPVVAEDGATILRTANGIAARLAMPTPVPGDYLYPDGNVFQPTVIMGSPEVFTGWIFIFNDPSECSDPCDLNDLGPTPARGGAYNFAGHAAAGSTLNLAGRVSIGDQPFAGVPLDDPYGAEVHLAVAPHGQLQPALLPTQINTPIGMPMHWWLAIFLP